MIIGSHWINVENLYHNSTEEENILFSWVHFINSFKHEEYLGHIKYQSSSFQSKLKIKNKIRFTSDKIFKFITDISKLESD